MSPPNRPPGRHRHGTQPYAVHVWFWAAYLVASQTPGMSAVQFQRQLGLSRYETAFGILHKLRAGMVRPDQNRIGGRRKSMSRSMRPGSADGHAAKAEASTTRCWWPALSRFAIGSRERHRTSERMAAMRGEFDWQSSQTEAPIRFVNLSRAPSLPGTLIVTDDWSGYASLRKRGYDHHAIAECGDPEVTEEFLPIIHLVFANLKTWLDRYPSRRQHTASTSLPQRVHVSLQPALLPVQRVPLVARHRW